MRAKFIKRFDPSAKTFCPYQLDMKQEEIIRCVEAYRQGENWEDYLPSDSIQSLNFVRSYKNEHLELERSHSEVFYE